MSADNLFVSGSASRDRWRSLTEAQREQAARLVVAVLAGAVAGSSQAVSSALAEAGRLSAALEEHVVWAAGKQVGDLMLTVDPKRQISCHLSLGFEARRREREGLPAQEGLFL